MTKIPTEIIELAIKGQWYSGFLNPEKLRPCSWTFDGEYLVITADTSIMVRKCAAEVALDREFWRALGEALRWTEYPTKRDVIGDDWHDHARRFYDLVLSGQDPTEFWAQLTAKDN